MGCILKSVFHERVPIVTAAEALTLPSQRHLR
jgi:hypothetical protein